MIRNILADHFEKYPTMQPQDAVKLIYQHEFGPGHMIADSKKALKFLQQEMDSLTPDGSEPLYESIGNGLCRLNLRPCLKKNIPAEDILHLFLETAKGIQGDKKQFQKKLQLLEQMANRDETPFYAAELDYFLIIYREKGCPAIHHSDAYNAAYHPAYRVVFQKKLKDYLAQQRENAEK
ncbi:MAG: hypothetical protein E7324_01795 [Clostridiales bacterium]|nr:hypothetical protein [Clostridiales bacterium]